MLLELSKAKRLTKFNRLINLPAFHFSSYFDNFTQKINPDPNSMQSYRNPKYHKLDKVRRFDVPLPARAQKLVQEQRFRLFKEKMIGVNWDSNIKIPDDPLWGAEIPNHYVQARGVFDYYKIKPYEGTQNHVKVLPSELVYKSEIVSSLTLQNLSSCSPFNLIQFLLKQQQQHSTDHQYNLKVFDLAEKILTPKLHEIALIDLVRLRHALIGPTRYGSPKFLSTIKKIIIEQYEELNPQGLLAAFTTQRFEKYPDVQDNIISIILKQKNLSYFTESNEKLLELIECYATYRVPEWKRKRFQRVQSQDKIDAISFIHKLPVQQSITFLTNNQKIKLMKAFQKLKLQGFKHVLYKIATTTNQQQLTPRQAIQYLQLLTKLQNGEGYINVSQLQILKTIFLQNWQSYNNYEKVKIIYTYWNLDHSWEQFKSLYQQIPIEVDINILYLVSQIEIVDSTGRQHEIFRALMEVQYIPIPYFYKLKQFLVLGYTFRWNMVPLIQKFEQTEVFTNALRLKQNLTRDNDVINLGKFLTIITPNLKHFIPIENFTVVQYVMQSLLIGIETIHSRDIAPNGQLKRSFIARNKILQNLGWNLIQVKWGQFSKLSINKQHKFIYNKIQQIIPIQQQKKYYRQMEESIQIRKLANIRQVQVWQYDNHEDFIESFRPTQQQIDRIGQYNEQQVLQQPVEQVQHIQETQKKGKKQKA